MLDKKQRIALRSLASSLKQVVWVGKEGFTPNVLAQIEQQLFDHELIKIAMQENVTPPTEFELSEMAVKINAEVVTTIGRKIVLYRHSEKKNIKHVL